MKEDFVKYFKDAGFEVDWDFDSEYAWYEIIYEGKLLVQIEAGVSMETLIEDLKSHKHGFGDRYDQYWIAGTEENFQKFLSLLPL